MIKIKQAKNGQFFFTIQAKNGQVIVTSETYKSKAGVWKGIWAIIKVFLGGEDLHLFTKENLQHKGLIKDETVKK